MCLTRKQNIYKITWRGVGIGFDLIVAKNEQQALKKFERKHVLLSPTAIELYLQAK